jgi:hypothetical protein
MAGVESLNVASAATVIAFEAARQAGSLNRGRRPRTGRRVPNREDEDMTVEPPRRRHTNCASGCRGRRRRGDARRADGAKTLLGKKSELSMARRSLGSLEPDQRREAGAVQRHAQALGGDRGPPVELAAEHRASMEAKRSTSPAIGPVSRGHVHPDRHPQQLEDSSSGWASRWPGPDLETDWFNFSALSIRPIIGQGMHDTFHLDLGGPGDYVLRTHVASPDPSCGRSPPSAAGHRSTPSCRAGCTAGAPTPRTWPPCTSWRA